MCGDSAKLTNPSLDEDEVMALADLYHVDCRVNHAMTRRGEYNEPGSAETPRDQVVISLITLSLVNLYTTEHCRLHYCQSARDQQNYN